MRMVVFDDEAAVGRLVVRVGALVGLEAAAVSDAEAFRLSLLDAPPQISKQSKRGVSQIAPGIRHAAAERVGRIDELEFSWRLLDSRNHDTTGSGSPVGCRARPPIKQPSWRMHAVSSPTVPKR